MRATLVAPHGPWPRPHHPQQPCWPPPWEAADCRPQEDSIRQARPTLHWTCLTAETPLTLARGRAAWAVRPMAGWPSRAQLTDNHQHSVQIAAPLCPHRKRLSDTTPKQHTQAERSPLLLHPLWAALTSPPSASDPQEPDSEGEDRQINGFRRHFRPVVPTNGRPCPP